MLQQTMEVVGKAPDEKTPCYFCYQGLDPEEVGSRRTAEHHVNFPKCDYQHLIHVTVWCHQSCQQKFHRHYDDHCRRTSLDKLRCDVCDPVWAIICLYNKNRFRNIDDDELSQILSERKWLARAEERAKKARESRTTTKMPVFVTE